MSKLFEYSGIGFPAIWNGAYASIDSKIAMDGLSSTGANSISLTSTAFVSNLQSSSVYTKSGSTESDENLLVAMRDAHARGLTVMVKPHVVPDSNDWIGDLKPGNVDAFFASYKEFILDQAKLAQQGNADIFVIGNEMDSLVGSEYKAQWQDIISSVRDVYDGKLTYASDWHRPDLVSFWDDLDFVGINAYIRLTEKDDPSVDDLISAWTNPSEYDYINWGWGGKSAVEFYTDLAKELGKPLLFTETGYNSGKEAASDPANWHNPAAPDQDLQARLYQAFFEVWSAQSDVFKGVFLWNWSTLADPTSEGGWSNNLTIQMKPAAKVVEAFYNADGLDDSVIKLRLSSDKYGEDAHFKVYADGVLIGEGSVSADFSKGQAEEFSFKADSKPSKISVVYDNDAYGGAGSKDRNLYVDWVEVDGARLEGENAASNTGYNGASRAFFQTIGMGKMNVNGTMTFNTADADPAETTIHARISGTSFEGNPIYYIVADGVIIASGEVTVDFRKGEWMDVSVTGSFGADGPSQVQVFFGNDYWKAEGKDRNLYVDYISINGRYYRGEDAINTADGGDPAINKKMGIGVMAENGSLTFDATNSIVSPDRIQLRLTGDHYKADPHFWLVVDGVKVAQGTVFASKAAGELQDFVFVGDFGLKSNSKVQVIYDNDYYDKATGGDRNLYVDFLEVNGVQYQGQNAATTAYNGALSNLQALQMSKMNVNGTITFDFQKMVASSDHTPGKVVAAEVHGSSFDDIIYAETAAKLWGGKGADTFVFTPQNLQGSSIQDFHRAENDVLLLVGFGEKAALTTQDNHTYMLATEAGTFQFEVNSTDALTAYDLILV